MGTNRDVASEFGIVESWYEALNISVRQFLARGERMFSVYNSTKELSDAGIDTAIVSVGATEQCGPHLPLHIDTLVAGYYARAWGEILNASTCCPPCPSIPLRSMPRSGAP